MLVKLSVTVPPRFRANATCRPVSVVPLQISFFFSNKVEVELMLMFCFLEVDFFTEDTIDFGLIFLSTFYHLLPENNITKMRQ